MPHAVDSRTETRDLLWSVDAVTRLAEAQLVGALSGLTDADVKQRLSILRFVQPGPLWWAFDWPGATRQLEANRCGGSKPPVPQGWNADKGSVLLIDEIDKADLEFPNDLLHELDRMSFYVYETGETVVAKQRPVIIITSNNEKELPDAFLRRCFFHYIDFPDEATMRQIIAVHFPHIRETLVSEALQIFFKLRQVSGLKKPPSTSELIDWLSLLMADDMPEEVLRNRDPKSAIPPLYGALIKNEQDVQLLERLAFMSRR